MNINCDELREALERLERADLSVCNIDDRAVALTIAAARRFLHLTETGAGVEWSW